MTHQNATNAIPDAAPARTDQRSAHSPHPDLGRAPRATGRQSREGHEASRNRTAATGPTLTAGRRALPQLSQVGVGPGRTGQEPPS